MVRFLAWLAKCIELVAAAPDLTALVQKSARSGFSGTHFDFTLTDR